MREVDSLPILGQNIEEIVELRASTRLSLVITTRKFGVGLERSNTRIGKNFAISKFGVNYSILGRIVKINKKSGFEN